MTFFQKYKYLIMFTAFILYTSTVFYSGVKVHEYYVGYQQNIDRLVQESIDKSVSEFQRKQAQGLEDTKNLLKDAKVKTIEKQLPIYIDRPIYLNKCGDEDGINVLEAYKQQSNSIRKGEIK